MRRGSYGGAVGLAGNGDMDTRIVIRPAFVKNGEAIVWLVLASFTIQT